MRGRRRCGTDGVRVVARADEFGAEQVRTEPSCPEHVAKHCVHTRPEHVVEHVRHFDRAIEFAIEFVIDGMTERHVLAVGS